MANITVLAHSSSVSHNATLTQEESHHCITLHIHKLKQTSYQHLIKLQYNYDQVPFESVQSGTFSNTPTVRDRPTVNYQPANMLPLVTL